MPQSLRWLCLAASLAASGLPGRARGELIIPGSVPSPPPAVGPAQGAAVPASADLVVDQYAGLGLRFPVQPGFLPGTGLSVAVVRLAGVDAWAPAALTEAVAGRVASLDYSRSIAGQLGRPTGSLSVETVGISGEALLAYDGHGRLVGSAWFSGRRGPHGGELLTVQGADIRSFTVIGPLLPLAAATPLPFPFPPPQPWGVAEVQFASAPESASLALAALGVGLSLCVGVGRARRARRAGLSMPDGPLGSRP